MLGFWLSLAKGRSSFPSCSTKQVILNQHTIYKRLLTILFVSFLINQPVFSIDQKGIFSFGPTGIIGHIEKSQTAQSIRVLTVFKGSPAQGLLHRGDLIIGLNAKTFSHQEDLALAFGQYIETCENRGRSIDLFVQKVREPLLKDDFQADELLNANRHMRSPNHHDSWHDKLWDAPQLTKAERQTLTLESVGESILLTLPTLGQMSSGASRTDRKNLAIIDNALNSLHKSLKKEPNKMGRRYLLAHSLLASGNSESISLVRNFIRSNQAFSPQRVVNENHPNGTRIYSYQCLLAAQYYLQTNDAYIRDSLSELASSLARGQSLGGSWGDRILTDSMGRAFLPGVNHAIGGVSSLGLVMTMRSGIQDPFIEKAIERSKVYYESIFQREGGTPSSFISSMKGYPSDGRDGLVSLNLAFMGDFEKAHYFAKRSLLEASQFSKEAHSSSAQLWSSLALIQAGPLALKVYFEQQSPWLTLARRHDGGFVSQRPKGGILLDDESTAIHLLPYLASRKNNLLAGKDAPESFFANDQLEYQDLLKSDEHQWLKKLSTDQLLAKKHHFSPEFRRQVAKELGSRFLTGQYPKLPLELTKMLLSASAKARSFGLLALSACGEEVTLFNLKAIQSLWKDPVPYVRLDAVEAMAPIQLQRNPKLVHDLVTELFLEEYEKQAFDANTVPDKILSLLFLEKTDSTNRQSFSEAPFSYGLDRDLSLKVLDRALRWENGNLKVLTDAKEWSKDQIIEMLGSIVHAAENHQINHVSSAIQSRNLARLILDHHGFKKELIESVGHRLVSLRKATSSLYDKAYKDSPLIGGLIEEKWLLKYPSFSKKLIPDIRRLYVHNPLGKFVSGGLPLRDLTFILEKAPALKPESTYKIIQQQFLDKLEKIVSDKSKISYCKSQLQPSVNHSFIQKASMEALINLEGVKSIPTILPFLGHSNERLRNQALSMIQKLGPRATPDLCRLFSISDDVKIKSGIMESLTLLADPEAFSTILAVSVSEDSNVRREATKALFSSTGLKYLERMMVLFKTCLDENVLKGYEDALLSLSRQSSAQQEIVSNAVLSVFHECTPEAFQSACYLLAQIGGWANLNTLARACLEKNEVEFQVAVKALSLSPDPKASQHLLNVLNHFTGMQRSFDIAKMAVSRMVMTSEEGGFLSNEERFAYAEEILLVVSEPNILTQLGYIPGLESVELLFTFLKQGTLSVSNASLEALIRISKHLDHIDELKERDLMIELFGKTYSHLLNHRLQVEDILTGEMLFPNTQKQLTALDQTLQRYIPTDNLKTRIPSQINHPK